jgi:hypothetical protein
MHTLQVGMGTGQWSFPLPSTFSFKWLQQRWLPSFLSPLQTDAAFAAFPLDHGSYFFFFFSHLLRWIGN